VEGVSCCSDSLHVFNIFAATSRAEGKKKCVGCKHILIVTASSVAAEVSCAPSVENLAGALPSIPAREDYAYLLELLVASAVTVMDNR
jgi:hypothetical protein